MSKYKVGDKFVCEITEVDDSGMGTFYWFNDRIRVYNEDLDSLVFAGATVEEVQPDITEEKTHTLESLKERVFILSKLLANTIESYEKVQKEVNGAVEYIDSVINEMGGSV